MRKAPKRGGILKLDHDMTIEQRIWHIRRHRAGGKTYVLIKVGQWYMLFKGYIAAEFLGKLTIQELREKALGVWRQKLNDKELNELLKKS